MDAKNKTALYYFLMGIYDLKIIKLDDNDKINQLSDLYHDALKMQKEQIIAANEDCLMNELGELLSGEQYYNETYGN
jgi:hypothetical protein